MSRILFINQNFIDDSRLDCVSGNMNSTDRSMLAYFCRMSYGNHARQFGLMPRAGTNIFPFRNDALCEIDSVMPIYDPGFSKTWDEITDQRSQDIDRLVEQGRRPVILWSGGIDSTCIVSAILKNCNAVVLDQITVALTAQSVLENPLFYYQHILPNFTTVDTNWFSNHRFMQDKSTVVIDGYGADTLTMSMTPSLDVGMAVRNPDQLNRDWREADQLIDYLSNVSGNKQFAVWYYERNRESIESVDVPIQTNFDFMWWFGFNCEYYTWALHPWFAGYRHLGMNYQDFKTRCIGWFRTDEYQQWAMNNNGPMVKHGADLASFKKHAKQYIFDLDGNEIYFKYKTKINSAGRFYYDQGHRPFAITDEFEILDLDQDLKKIQELFPSCIKS